MSKVLASIPFSPPMPHTTVTIDAVLLGWGAHLEGHMIQGLWFPRKAWMHINILELRTVCLACQAFLLCQFPQCSTPFRQHNGRCLYKQTGQCEISIALCTGHTPLGLVPLAQGHAPCHLPSGHQQLPCRLTQPFLSQQSQVEAAQPHSPLKLPSVGHTVLEPLCDHHLPQASPLLFQGCTWGQGSQRNALILLGHQDSTMPSQPYCFSCKFCAK